MESKPLFEDFSDDDIKEILNYSVKTSYAEGDYLFNKGDLGLDIYIIFSGSVELIGINSEQNEVVINTIGDGTVLGEIAFFDKKERTVSAKAITPLETIILKYESFEKLEENNPQLALKILKELGRIVSDRLRDANEIILDFIK